METTQIDQYLKVLKQTIDSRELPDLTEVSLTYHPQTFIDQIELMQALGALEIKQGWITWPDQVQCLMGDNTSLKDCNMPPLEAELVLSGGHSLRLNYRAGVWHWVEISIATEGAGNALSDTQIFAARDKGAPALCYQRIWQYEEASGMNVVDAVFTGFREERT